MKKNIFNSVKIVFRKVVFFLTKIERKIISRKMQLEYPPIFILGPPRSGTTLVYQSLIHSCQLSFFTNFSCKYPQIPVLLTLLSKFFAFSSKKNAFKSFYGESAGLFSPSQARHVWCRWFPRDQSYVNAGELSIQDKMELFNTISSIASIGNAPFINKAQGHCSRILPLCETFNQIVFIRVNRNPLYTIQSILIGKEKIFNDTASWFSVKPKNYDKIKSLDPVKLACMQVLEINNDLNRDLGTISQNDIFEINYEDFCSSPQDIIDSFVDFYYQKTGYKILIKQKITVPFRVSNCIRLQSDVINKIKAYL